MNDQLALADEINEIYRKIKTDLAQDPESLILELSFRCGWLARSSELKADAQFYLNKRRGEVAEQHIGTEESWNIVKHLIEAGVRDEQRILELADRLNATITHQLDAIRSILSFEKESMKNNPGA